MMPWAILTGEYPPQPGGVSDYTRNVARGLAQAGQAVRVFAPACVGADPADAGVRVQRLSGGFGARGLKRLGAELATAGAQDRLLVQYAPHAFGWKGMNVPFCLWLRARK